jgi:hypothetical protein
MGFTTDEILIVLGTTMPEERRQELLETFEYLAELYYAQWERNPREEELHIRDQVRRIFCRRAIAEADPNNPKHQPSE